MKVVLIQDVQKVGKKFDIKDVSDGYGRNFLIKNKLAELATPKNLKNIDELKQKNVAVKKMQEAEVQKSLEKLATLKITIKRKANDEGHLFAGIDSDAVSDFIKSYADLVVMPEYIKLDKPIKSIGEYHVSVDVGSKKGVFTLNVEKE